jgi:hypothetical protein
VAVIGGMNLPGPLPYVLWFVASYALPIALVLWVTADMRAHGRTPPFDLPFLLLLVFPISLFWYCIWTRGWPGLLLAMGLFAVACLPAFVTEFARIAAAVLLRRRLRRLAGVRMNKCVRLRINKYWRSAELSLANWHLSHSCITCIKCITTNRQLSSQVFWLQWFMFLNGRKQKTSRHACIG